MGKIVFLMGKSSTGKDTVFKELLDQEDLGLKVIITYTTRPIRDGEIQGQEYFFVDEKAFQKLKESGRVIEDRIYHTCHGPWRYFTVDDGRIDLEHQNYIMIGTLESYLKNREYFGEDKLLPVLIELDDGERLQRALDREKNQDQPKYEEMCRRFLADGEDFSQKNIEAAGIKQKFYNNQLKVCIEEIEKYIKKHI